ncbi:hypothetical protein HK103_002595 [Boothiomyces macroporosus]|uniref:Uncharacterized protein n=1 Tax=Boothiomyces macroporosus TaxID=261099 RepID=A0AAD5U979_9FUNG|nr:hypothetical protein HK103_002595 [Boothiomyces macroporosus]
MKPCEFLTTRCEDWSILNGMKFAATKCIFVGDENIHDYRIYNVPISSEKQPKYLGIPLGGSGIDLALNAQQRATKTRAVTHMLAELGMNSTGFPQEASVRMYKAFIRPTFEYGLQLGTLDKPSLELLQKAQNLALRMILGANRSTSIAAMHKLCVLETVSQRNNYLSTCFFAPLINNDPQVQDFPATTLVQAQIRTHTASTLFSKAVTQNSLLQSLLNRANLNALRWIPFENQVQDLVQLPEKSYFYDLLVNMEAPYHRPDPETVTVAGAVCLVEKETTRVVLTSKVKMQKKIRAALLKWLTGGVARHQECKCGQELSRSHAVLCSGVGAFLNQHLPRSSAHYQMTNPLDSTINFYRLERNPEVYLLIFRCIQAIYVNCLGYQQRPNGYYSSEEQARNDAAAAGLEPNIVEYFPMDAPDIVQLAQTVSAWPSEPPEVTIATKLAQATDRRPSGRVYTWNGVVDYEFLPVAQRNAIARRNRARNRVPNRYNRQFALPAAQRAIEIEAIHDAMDVDAEMINRHYY